MEKERGRGGRKGPRRDDGKRNTPTKALTGRGFWEGVSFLESFALRTHEDVGLHILTWGREC